MYLFLVFSLVVARQPQLFMAIFHPKLPEKDKHLAISSFLPESEDTFLSIEDINKLVARFSNAKPQEVSRKVSESGLLQASSFPDASPCPELVLAYLDKYDATEKCICTYSGEVPIYVSRFIIMGALGTPSCEVYED